MNEENVKESLNNEVKGNKKENNKKIKEVENMESLNRKFVSEEDLRNNCDVRIFKDVDSLVLKDVEKEVNDSHALGFKKLSDEDIKNNIPHFYAKAYKIVNENNDSISYRCELGLCKGVVINERISEEDFNVLCIENPNLIVDKRTIKAQVKVPCKLTTFTYIDKITGEIKRAFKYLAKLGEDIYLGAKKKSGFLSSKLVKLVIYNNLCVENNISSEIYKKEIKFIEVAYENQLKEIQDIDDSVEDNDFIF